MKNLVSLVVFMTNFSCTPDQKAGVNKSRTVEKAAVFHAKEKVLPNNAKLETFAFPAEVEGCSCYFAKDKQDFEQEKYVYVDEFGKNAFLKSEGKMLKIPLKKEDFEGENFKRKIQNKEISVEIDGRKIKDMEEVMMFEGNMTVTYKTGEKITTPIYGECGC